MSTRNEFTQKYTQGIGCFDWFLIEYLTLLADTILALLGYEAFNMKYGMMGWTDDPDILVQSVFDCEPPNYETEAGT